jgi:hypothetical protein
MITYIQITYQSRDSSGCKETKPRAGKRVTLVKLPVGVTRLSLIQNVRTDSRAHPAPFSVGSKNSVPRYKASSLTFYLQLETLLRMRVAVPLLPVFLIASTGATLPTLRFRTVIGDTSQPFTLTACDNPKRNYIYSSTKATQQLNHHC